MTFKKSGVIIKCDDHTQKDIFYFHLGEKVREVIMINYVHDLQNLYYALKNKHLHFKI